MYNREGECKNGKEKCERENVKDEIVKKEKRRERERKEKKSNGMKKWERKKMGDRERNYGWWKSRMLWDIVDWFERNKRLVMYNVIGCVGVCVSDRMVSLRVLGW